MKEIEAMAKDFCEWWNVGALNDVTTRKACREDAISELKNLLTQTRLEALEDYSKWLEETGYLDSDWWCEKPTSIDRYLAERKVKAIRTLAKKEENP